MASSGRVPYSVRRRMHQRVTIRSRTGTNRYGQETYSTGPGRKVNAQVQPSKAVIRNSQGTEVVASFAVYLDDIDVVADDQVELPDGTSPTIARIDTYFDHQGKVYQVLYLE